MLHNGIQISNSNHIQLTTHLCDLHNFPVLVVTHSGQADMIFTITILLLTRSFSIHCRPNSLDKGLSMLRTLVEQYYTPNLEDHQKMLVII